MHAVVSQHVRVQKRASTAADGALDDAIEDFRRSRQFPDSRRISAQFPVILTPSEQVSEQARAMWESSNSGCIGI